MLKAGVFLLSGLELNSAGQRHSRIDVAHPCSNAWCYVCTVHVQLIGFQKNTNSGDGHFLF